MWRLTGYDATFSPLIGGSLQHPYERFGGVFRLSKFWKTNPYFLPCVTAAIYSTSAFVLAFVLLKEVRPLAFLSDVLKVTNPVLYADLTFHY